MNTLQRVYANQSSFLEKYPNWTGFRCLLVFNVFTALSKNIFQKETPSYKLRTNADTTVSKTSGMYPNLACCVLVVFLVISALPLFLSL